MELKFILFADAANISETGKLNIAGEFNGIHADSFPALWPFVAVVARLEALPVEGPDHTYHFQLVTGDGAPILSAPPEPLKFSTPGPGLPRRANIIIQIAPLVLPIPGDYAFHLFVDGVHRGNVTLFVRKVKLSDAP